MDVVLVLDHERLYLDLQRDLPSTTNIVPLPKSGGVSGGRGGGQKYGMWVLLYLVQVVVRTREFRRKTREDVVREYFYGKKPHPLSPFSFEVSFSDVEIFKIGGRVTT